MLAKRGAAATERMLGPGWRTTRRSSAPTSTCWSRSARAAATSASPTTTTSARILEEDPDFPVAPAWPDQDGAGAHTNLSGVGLVRGSDQRADAVALMEHLTAPPAQEQIVENGELAVNAAVPPAEHIREWADVKRDPIDVARAGRLLPEAVALMQQVGWE